MNSYLNQTCTGFINCNHPSKKKSITEKSAIAAHQLEKWNVVKYDAYTLIEESSGIPVSISENNFTVQWTKTFTVQDTVTHYTFWTVKEKNGLFETDNKYNHLSVNGKYVITTRDNTGLKCLQFSPSNNLLNWVSLDENIKGLPFDKTIVWRVLNNRTHIKRIIEGDSISLVSETATNKIVVKQASGCDFNQNPLFTIEETKNISALSNKFYGQAIHEESVPICTYNDCQNECTLFKFQILGVGLTANEKVTLQATDNDSNSAYLNTTTNLTIGTMATGLSVLALLVILIVVVVYYYFIPKEYDYVSKVSFHDMYSNVKDLITF